MRVIVLGVVMLAALAGCTAPEAEPVSPLFGVCPQWVSGDWEATQNVDADGEPHAVAFPEAGAALDEEYQGLALDRYTIQFHNVSLDGKVEVRAYADDADRRIAFTDYRDGAASSLLFATLEDGADLELDVFLTAVAHGTQAAPDGLRLEFSGPGVGSIAWTLTGGYRVCGAPV